MRPGVSNRLNVMYGALFVWAGRRLGWFDENCLRVWQIDKSHEHVCNKKAAHMGDCKCACGKRDNTGETLVNFFQTAKTLPDGIRRPSIYEQLQREARKSLGDTDEFAAPSVKR